MIQHPDFKIDSPNMEIPHFCIDQFPYACLYEPMQRHVDATISWHWHQCYEIVYVAEGEMECHSPDQTLRLQKGQAVFVNAGVLHLYQQVSQVPCILYAHIFDAGFLTGSLGSHIYQKYISPISKSPGMQLQAIRPDNHHQKLMLEHLQTMTCLAEQEPFGYEFQLQYQISQVWCRLLTMTAGQQAAVPGLSGTDIQRVKAMLNFIHTHFSQNPTLQQIAEAASISQRECSRCFQRCFQTSAMGYLYDYRIRMATRMLLESQLSITQISQSCGFCSPSYFGRRFAEVYGCSPREYRKKAVQSPD